MDKYILLKRKALNLDECEHIISYFKRSHTPGWDPGQRRVEKELGRSCVSGSLQLPYFSNLKLVLHDAIDEYVNKHHQFLHNLDFFFIQDGLIFNGPNLEKGISWNIVNMELKNIN